MNPDTGHFEKLQQGIMGKLVRPDGTEVPKHNGPEVALIRYPDAFIQIARHIIHNDALSNVIKITNPARFADRGPISKLAEYYRLLWAERKYGRTSGIIR